MSVRAPAGAMGKTAYNAVIGRGVAAIKGNEFIYQLLVKMDADGFWKILSCGSTFESLNSENIKNAEVKIPTTAEQIKIGGYFQQLDNLITLHQREFAFLCKEKSKKFRYIKNAWEQRKLGDVAKYRNGKAHENDISEQGKFIVVNSKFVSTNGEVRKFSNKQIEPLFKNEIAFVLSDVPNGRAIARTFLVDKNDKYTLNQRIAGITPIEGTCPYFLHILMNRNKYFLQFDDGAKQTNLSVDDVIEFAEYYPSSEEQQQIGNFFRQLDNLITLHQRKPNFYTGGYYAE